jgi:poly(3-hydroxybutyrate) depolymerase
MKILPGMSHHCLMMLVFTVFLLSASGCQAARNQSDKQAIKHADEMSLERQCIDRGWKPVTVYAAGIKRSVLWHPAKNRWRQGAIIVLHGGGGSHVHFCAGSKLVQPQIAFARSAIAQGFAVFLLDSTNDIVTDEAGNKCGKRFDFSVLNRKNIDLPFINKVITDVIPRRRPGNASKKIFITGLSTGGYMTIRAATHFDDKVTAFAPVSAGDPYGTESNCDASLSPRKSAKGVLLDLETGKKITELGACRSFRYPNEKSWDSGKPSGKPVFRQFHNEGDAIVDISCMKKAQIQLTRHGYQNAGEFLLKSRHRRALNHLWLKRYNQPILDFFKRQ